MIYYTADLHLGHDNVLKFDNRPFADSTEMWQVMLELWNSRVKDDDDVYILGDVCFRSKYAPEFYLQQLKGKKHLLIGNHDGAILESPMAMKCFESLDYLLRVEDGKDSVILSHFPLAEWAGMKWGNWHVYGHIHCRRNETSRYMFARKRALNAGCMINHYMPVTLEELIENNRMFQKGE